MVVTAGVVVAVVDLLVIVVEVVLDVVVTAVSLTRAVGKQVAFSTKIKLSFIIGLSGNPI